MTERTVKAKCSVCNSFKHTERNCQKKIYREEVMFSLLHSKKRPQFCMFDKNFLMRFIEKSSVFILLDDDKDFLYKTNSVEKKTKRRLVSQAQEIWKVHFKQNNTFQCGICLDSMLNEDKNTTNCGHSFCRRCYNEMIQKTLDDGRKTYVACPMCRQNIARTHIRVV